MSAATLLSSAAPAGKHPYASSVTLLCLGVPPGQPLDFGLNLTGWRTAAAFRGVKLLPVGTHAVASGLPGAPPAAFFLHAHAGEVAAAVWDAAGECLVPAAQGDDDVAGARGDAIQAAVASLTLDRFLGAAPSLASAVAPAHGGGASWAALTSFLGPRVLARLQPVAHMQREEVMTDEKEESDRKSGESRRMGRCFYSRIAGVGSTATSAERTAYGVDTSQALRGVLASCSRAADADSKVVDAPADAPSALFAVPGAPPVASRVAACALCAAEAGTGVGAGLSRAAAHLCGELQFSFLSFLVGQSYTGFEQWKHLVDALCRCEELLLSASSAGAGAASVHFFVAAFRCTAAQLAALPADFFVDELSRRNFLGVSLAALVRTATTYVNELDTQLTRAVLSLCDAAAAAFGGWAPAGADQLRAAVDVLGVVSSDGRASAVVASAGGGSGGDSDSAYLSADSDQGMLRAHAVAVQEGLLRPRGRISLRGAGGAAAGSRLAPMTEESDNSAADVAPGVREGGLTELLEALRAQGGDDDLPAIEYTEA